MTDVSNMFVTDKPYATASDYEDISQQDTIESAGTDEFNGESFVWVKLGGIPKPIRLNKTNGRAMLQFGNSTEEWVGKPVFITTASGQFDSGKSWVGWRISAIKAANVPTPAAPINDDIPM